MQCVSKYGPICIIYVNYIVLLLQDMHECFVVAAASGSVIMG